MSKSRLIRKHIVKRYRESKSRIVVTRLWLALQMYIRDGCSMIGGLLFTAVASGRFEGDIKRWRMFAGKYASKGEHFHSIHFI
jgi:hypothetical protein